MRHADIFVFKVLMSLYLKADLLEESSFMPLKYYAARTIRLSYQRFSSSHVILDS